VSRAQGPRSSGGAARRDDEQWQAPNKARPSYGVVAAAAAAALDAPLLQRMDTVTPTCVTIG
jgi:hypothetical protein